MVKDVKSTGWLGLGTAATTLPASAEAVGLGLLGGGGGSGGSSGGGGGRSSVTTCWGGGGAFRCSWSPRKARKTNNAWSATVTPSAVGQRHLALWPPMRSAMA